VTSVSFVVTVLGAHEQLVGLEKRSPREPESRAPPPAQGVLLFDLRATDFFRPGGTFPIEPLACFTLSAFVHTVSTGGGSGTIAAALATEWIEAGKRIEAVIGCRVAPRAD
jgi:hypothetical protein